MLTALAAALVAAAGVLAVGDPPSAWEGIIAICGVLTLAIGLLNRRQLSGSPTGASDVNTYRRRRHRPSLGDVLVHQERFEERWRTFTEGIDKRVSKIEEQSDELVGITRRVDARTRKDGRRIAALERKDKNLS